MPRRRKQIDTTELRLRAETEAAAELAVIEEIARLRAEDASWQDIAEALGGRRQNAYRKYSAYRWDPETKRAYLVDL